MAVSVCMMPNDAPTLCVQIYPQEVPGERKWDGTSMAFISESMQLQVAAGECLIPGNNSTNSTTRRFLFEESDATDMTGSSSHGAGAPAATATETANSKTRWEGDPAPLIASLLESTRELAQRQVENAATSAAGAKRRISLWEEVGGMLRAPRKHSEHLEMLGKLDVPDSVMRTASIVAEAAGMGGRRNDHEEYWTEGLPMCETGLTVTIAASAPGAHTSPPS